MHREVAETWSNSLKLNPSMIGFGELAYNSTAQLGKYIFTYNISSVEISSLKAIPP